MNKILKDITYEMYNLNLDYVNIKKGNYRVVREKGIIKHYYFGNLICTADRNTKEFNLHHCGYKKFRMTTAQLNFLEKFYKDKEYILLYNGY